MKVSGQNGKRHKTCPVCPISLQFFSTCWSVSWDDAHQILFRLDKNSLSESIYNGPHPNCTVQLYAIKSTVSVATGAVAFIRPQTKSFRLRTVKFRVEEPETHRDPEKKTAGR